MQTIASVLFICPIVIACYLTFKITKWHYKKQIHKLTEKLIDKK